MDYFVAFANAIFEGHGFVIYCDLAVLDCFDVVLGAKRLEFCRKDVYQLLTYPSAFGKSLEIVLVGFYKP